MGGNPVGNSKEWDESNPEETGIGKQSRTLGELQYSILYSTQRKTKGGGSNQGMERNWKEQTTYFFVMKSELFSNTASRQYWLGAGRV